ncbi:uncharacterized protein V2V93DRAFT_364998 [Kockiozyma suomiensis]|uniref:uncharacterized protein n=1 Tax=Kockiozyma suomiensis TaxID=1337062 RepID=UPI00334338EE
MLISSARSTDITFLTSVFIFVKSVLFVIPQLVTQQYDTSSQIIFTSTKVPWIANYVLPRFLVWDPVFFIRIAQRGYIYEQEWAWGWLWMWTIRNVGEYLVSPILAIAWPELEKEVDDIGNQVESIYIYAIAAIIIAHIGHYLAVIMIYIASSQVEKYIRPLSAVSLKQESSNSRSVFPLLSALLYIISPGGIFMSAGYSETLFAFFSFLGIAFREADAHVLSGVAFCITCCLRGNGLLWGILFLNDLFEAARQKKVYKSLAIILGGTLVGGGFLAGQIYAYFRYCPGREWCNQIPPLIYGYVQSHYWGVGLFKYWRTWQIPNFFFAFPTWFLFYRSYERYKDVPHLRPYVIIQSVMGIMSLFIWHVQIITRLGTCMPLVYWYVAERLFMDEPEDAGEVIKGWGFKKILKRAKADFERHEGLWEVRYMITWIGVQAVLFASFIPPA